MMAMLQGLDARSFFVHAQLIGGIFLALFVKVFCNRLSAHDCECGRTIPFKLSYFGHFVTMVGGKRRAGQLCELSHSRQKPGLNGPASISTVFFASMVT